MTDNSTRPLPSRTKSRGPGRRVVIGGAAALLATPALRAQAQQSAGVALVIGNSKYQWEASLPNVRRDAPDIARRFQELGLKTDLVQDAGRDAMSKAIDSFVAGARGANFAALYFAGHGAAWGKDTYLVPVDTDLGNPNIVDRLLPVAALQTGMEAAANRLMVFDNCRNNPADGWRQREAVDAAGTRFAGPAPAPNTLLLYSTAPGRIALDGPPGANSPFAAALLRQLEGPSIDLAALPARLRRALLLATEGRQVLFDQNTFGQPFVLKGPAGKPATADRSGWAGDPSRLIELTNGYAYIRQHNLLMPADLVSHRAPAGSRHAEKVGSFKFESSTPDGSTVPALLVVLSVDEADGAECMLMLRFGRQAGWAFRRVPYKGDRLDMQVRTPGPRFEFKWSDANSGSTTVFPPDGGGRALHPFTSKFQRLDG